MNEVSMRIYIYAFHRLARFIHTLMRLRIRIDICPVSFLCVTCHSFFSSMESSMKTRVKTVETISLEDNFHF